MNAQATETTETEDFRLYDCFVRNWWRSNPSYPGGREPHAGPKKYIARRVSWAEARRICQEYNATHNPGKLSRKAEFEER